MHRIGSAVSHLGDVSLPTLAIGLGVFATLLVSERVDRRLPGALMGLVGATALVGVFGLDHHGVAVLGTFDHGAPHLGLSGVTWATIVKLAPLALRRRAGGGHAIGGDHPRLRRRADPPGRRRP